MKQTLTVEAYGLSSLDHHSLVATEGGTEIGYFIGQVLGWGIIVCRELARGAGESAEEMPGLK